MNIYTIFSDNFLKKCLFAFFVFIFVFSFSSARCFGLMVSDIVYKLEIPAGSTSSYELTVKNDEETDYSIEVAAKDWIHNEKGENVFLPKNSARWSFKKEMETGEKVSVDYRVKKLDQYEDEGVTINGTVKTSQGTYEVGGDNSFSLHTSNSSQSNSPVEAVRSIDECESIEGYKCITVDIETLEKVRWMHLTERYPVNFKIESLDRAGAQFFTVDRSCADWIKLDNTEFELPAGEERTVSFDFRVPDGVKGNYWAGISIAGDPETGYKKRFLIKLYELTPSTGNYSIPYVVSHLYKDTSNFDPADVPIINTVEILKAIAWWADETQVPNTGGETISTDMVLGLISDWADGKEITETTGTTTRTTEANTRTSTTTHLKDLSQKLSTETLPATQPLTVNLSFRPEGEIAGLVLDLKLPEGWSLVPNKDKQPAYKPSRDQLLWLNLKGGEPVQLTYQVQPPSNIEAITEYEIQGKLISKSPNLNRQLSTKTVTLTPPPELSLQETTVHPNPVTGNQEITFRAEGQGIVSTKLQVYEASGKKLYQTSYRKGNTITWDLTDSEENELTNGIYLYRIKARGVDETVQTSEVQRLLVLR